MFEYVWYLLGWTKEEKKPKNLDGGEDLNVKVMTEKVKDQIKKVDKELIETDPLLENKNLPKYIK